MSKLNVAVLFGGCSPEYSVSLESAHAVLSNMDAEAYNPLMIGITPDGEWFHFCGDIEKLTDDTWCNPKDCTPAVLSPNRDEHHVLLFSGNTFEKRPIDVVFPVLHGKNGEDGTAQGLIELAGIPLVGCGTLCSALCMDKKRAHIVAQSIGVSVPASFLLYEEDSKDFETIVKQADAMGYPVFVKPVHAGSSYGITKVMEQGQLAAAIDLAFQYDSSIVIEKGVSGFEVGCAVIGTGSELRVGELDEIELSEGFFDFKEKYTLETSCIHVPARIDQGKTEEIKHVAKLLYQGMGCSGFARVDMFLSDTGEIMFNEINTIPGFTTHSRFPTMFKACGISYEQIISMVIDSALPKAERAKNQIVPI